MGSPVIFNGSRSKLLTSKGPLLQSGQTLDYDGELNYIGNPSGCGDASAATPKGWVTSDASKLTVTKVATGLPRDLLSASGIKILSVASADSTNAYVYYDFTLDDVDSVTNRVLKIQWEQKPLAVAPAATDLVLSIVSSADHTTVLATPTITAIPVGEGQFACTFVAPTTKTCSLKISTPNNMADNAGIVLSNCIVGPGSLVQGAPVGPWTTSSWTTNASNTSAFVTKQRRVGDSMEVTGYMAFTGNGGASAALSFTIPSGFTIDNSKIPSSAYGTEATNGSGKWYDSSGAKDYWFNPYIASATTVKFISEGGSGSFDRNLIDNGDYIGFTFTVPIAEWSSNVFLASGADNNVTPLNWTSYTPTLGGITGGTYTPAAKYRRVGDSLEVQFNIYGSAVFTGGSNPTLTIPTGLTIDITKMPGTVAASDEYLGSGTLLDTSFSGADSTAKIRYLNTTTVEIVNALAADTAIDTTHPFTWANADRIVGTFTVPIVGWTAQDYLGKMLTGFATANLASPVGLLQAGAIPAQTTTAAAAGYASEVLYWTPGNTDLPAAGTATTVGTIALTAGRWQVFGKGYFEYSVATVSAIATQNISISLTAATHNTKSQTRSEYTSSLVDHIFSPAPIIVNTTGQNVYLIASSAHTADGTGKIRINSGNTEFYAVRLP